MIFFVLTEYIVLSFPCEDYGDDDNDEDYAQFRRSKLQSEKSVLENKN